MLVGDDEAFLAEATALAEQELGCKVFRGHRKYVMASHTQWKFNSLPLATRCTATLNLFTDLEMLAHADYFVGALLAHVMSVAGCLSSCFGARCSACSCSCYAHLESVPCWHNHCCSEFWNTFWNLSSKVELHVLMHSFAAVPWMSTGDGPPRLPAYHRAGPRQTVPSRLVHGATLVKEGRSDSLLRPIRVILALSVCCW